MANPSSILGFTDTDRLKEGIGMIAKGFLLIRSKTAIMTVDDEGNKVYQSEAELDLVSRQAQKSIMKKAADKLKNKNKAGLKAEDYSGSDYFPLEVQYNPSSIKLSTYSGKMVGGRPDMGAAGAALTREITVQTSTKLDMTLIFEDINLDDAFIVTQDNPFNYATPSGAKSLGASMIKKISSDRDDSLNREGPYSVRPIVDGLISLMAVKPLRDVFFFYGGTCFHGYLIGVNPTYKMFNKNGDPIYAEVHITIEQDTSREEDNDIWYNAYKNKFGDKDGKIGDAMQNNSRIIDANAL